MLVRCEEDKIKLMKWGDGCRETLSKLMVVGNNGLIKGGVEEGGKALKGWK
jgi:hypothetical protein